MQIVNKEMIILYVCFFGYWFYDNYKNNGFNISSFLLLLYMCSSVISVILLYGYERYDQDRINLYAIIFHVFCYFLFLKPLISFGNRLDLSKIQFPQIKFIKLISLFIILLSVASFAVNIPKMLYSFSFAELSEARKLHNARELFDNEKGILEYLGSLGTALSYYSLFFFFYFLAFYRRNKLIIFLLFFSSFAIVVNNLAIMGRDGIIRWLLFFVSLYIFFKDYLEFDIKNKIKRTALIPAIAFIGILGSITFSRFGERDYSVFYSVLSYAGQQNIYFSYNFEQFMDGLAGGRMNFSYFFTNRVSINNLNEIVYADYNLNTFSSFVGSFYMDLGLIKTFILALFLFIFNSFFLLRINFFKLIYFLIIYEVVLLSLFYYMFYSPTRVNTLILFLLLCYVIYMHKRIILKKNNLK